VSPKQIGIRRKVPVDFTFGTLELLCGLWKLLLFGGDIRAQPARQIVESREQDDNDYETEKYG